MVPLGLWIGIIGYGVLYAGVVKLGGGKCTLRQAFTGQCVPATSGSSSSSGTATTSTPASSSGIPASSPGGSGDFQP